MRPQTPQLSIQIPTRAVSPTPPTHASGPEKSELQLKLSAFLNKLTSENNNNEKKINKVEYHDDDDLGSNYGSDDESPFLVVDEEEETEANLSDEDEEEVVTGGSGMSSPASYIEFSSMNPYRHNHDAKTEEKWGQTPVKQTIVVPVRVETMEQTLARLSSQLESTHSAIRAEESAALRYLQTSLSDDEE
ncbi:hypothetical protein F4778DRAFT_730068 [Xylariomycetidae sp. FL2044]|nr:hypothetical protein F4778DRAFT_730068 [Xylariomycetidae sp. FL2044]